MAGYSWLGRVDKNAADNAAVQVMFIALKMFYVGEAVGISAGAAVDIAVDPIASTRMTALE
ncbi:hypothetical protein [Sodalis sp.]|uniref:hypothetical protein n=1 Tax=Sodalis sp. (in: enterobacteria) TaxID=1898979 RepID=UPI003873C4B8